jgi:YYY domain-containing protein
VSDLEALLRWYLVLTAVSFAFLPVVSWLGVSLGPARVGLMRPLGVVMLTAVVWWPAAAFGLPFNRWTLVIAFIVIASISWIGWLRAAHRDIAWLHVVAFEVLWSGAFLLYAWFRAYNPDIINTEKPMEIALLSSVIRSTAVPAPDPWLAGSAINYYYFGYQALAAVAKLSGVPASIAFNLSLATIFASVATAAAAIGHGLTRSIWPGRARAVLSAALATIFLVLAGNLETTRRLVRNPRETIDAGWWDGVGWQASRIITDMNVHDVGDNRQTINEFPAFSFVLGDLHPHVIAYPLLASVVALAISTGLRTSPPGALRLGIIGALVGLLYAANSWDAPMAWIVVVGSVALWHLRRHDVRGWFRDAGIVTLAAVIGALPFGLRFAPPVGVPNQELPVWLIDSPVIGTLSSTFGVVYWRPTQLIDLLIVHGVWLLAFLAFAAVHLRGDQRFRRSVVRYRHAVLTIGVLALGIAVAWAPAVLVIGIPLVVAIWIVLRGTERGIQVLAGIFAVGFALVLIPEFFFIQDVFLDRMNTVFKLYYQAWLLLGLASACALIDALTRISLPQRWLAAAGTALVVLTTLTYTPLSVWDWTDGLADRSGLDGRAYLSHSAPEDLAIINWIDEHAHPGDIIVEAPGNSYQNLNGAPTNRVSAFTGVPTLLGWFGHESQWRRGEYTRVDIVLDKRRELANRILDGDVAPVDTDARFVIIGSQEFIAGRRCDAAGERQLTPEPCLLQRGWVPLFRSGGSTVYGALDDPLATASR